MVVDKKANIDDMNYKYNEHDSQIQATKESFTMFTDDFTACLVEFNQMKKRIGEL